MRVYGLPDGSWFTSEDEGTALHDGNLPEGTVVAEIGETECVAALQAAGWQFNGNFERLPAKYVPFDVSEIIDVDGRRFAVGYSGDDDTTPPWERSDGHGPVRKAHSAREKRPGERPLNRPSSREWAFLYDWQEAARMARKDGWDAEPYGAPDRIQRAVQSDFDFLSGWVNGLWEYVCVNVCEVDEEGFAIGEPDCVGGVETYNAYHHRFARELAKELT